MIFFTIGGRGGAAWDVRMFIMTISQVQASTLTCYRVLSNYVSVDAYNFSIQAWTYELAGRFGLLSGLENQSLINHSLIT